MSEHDRGHEDSGTDEAALKFAAAANKNRGARQVGSYEPVDPRLLSREQARAWSEDGFFVIPAMTTPAMCEAINQAAISQVREIDATGDLVTGARFGGGAISIPEQNFEEQVERPEQRASKLYNLHRRGAVRDFAMSPELSAILGGLLGTEVGVFGSQFIFKNPGAWGQPWHQDSLYFRFDRFPQVGVWLATSPATVENGCLYVAPGSHREPLHVHLPDARPGANYGYLEIRDHDFDGAIPLLMEPGDVLIFHSFLMHRSVDNASADRRTALVLHCGEWGTRWKGLVSPTVDWVQTRRGGDPQDPDAVDARIPLSIRSKLAIAAWVSRIGRKFGKT